MEVKRVDYTIEVRRIDTPTDSEPIEIKVWFEPMPPTDGGRMLKWQAFAQCGNHPVREMADNFGGPNMENAKGAVRMYADAVMQTELL